MEPLTLKEDWLRQLWIFPFASLSLITFSGTWSFLKIYFSKGWVVIWQCSFQWMDYQDIPLRQNYIQMHHLLGFLLVWSWKCDLNRSYNLSSQSHVVCMHACTCARRLIYSVMEYTYFSNTLASRIGYLCWFQSRHANWCVIRKVYMAITTQLLRQFVKQKKTKPCKLNILLKEW